MKSIPVNNGRQLQLEAIPGGVSSYILTKPGERIQYREFKNGEIVALYDLMEYMKRHGLKRVYLQTADGTEEFPILQ